MSVLIDYISKIEQPHWEVLTYKLKWWHLKIYDARIVFKFYIRNNNKSYRIDYRVEDDDIIFCHQRPKDLLKKFDIEPSNDEFWLREQRELLRIFLDQYTCRINELINNKPQKPKWYKLIF